MLSIYFDPAASCFIEPEIVYFKINEVMPRIGANPGRSDHKMARRAHQVATGDREKISQLFNLPEVGRVIFTRNAREVSQAGFLLDDVYDILVRVGVHCTTNIQYFEFLLSKTNWEAPL